MPRWNVENQEMVWKKYFNGMQLVIYFPKVFRWEGAETRSAKKNKLNGKEKCEKTEIDRGTERNTWNRDEVFANDALSHGTGIWIIPMTSQPSETQPILLNWSFKIKHMQLNYPNCLNVAINQKVEKAIKYLKYTCHQGAL